MSKNVLELLVELESDELLQQRSALYNVQDMLATQLQKLNQKAEKAEEVSFELAAELEEVAFDHHQVTKLVDFLFNLETCLRG